MTEEIAQDSHDYEQDLRTNNRIFSTSKLVHTIVNLAFYLQGHKVISGDIVHMLPMFSQTKCHEIYPVYTAYFHFRAQNT